MESTEVLISLSEPSGFLVNEKSSTAKLESASTTTLLMSMISSLESSLNMLGAPFFTSDRVTGTSWWTPSTIAAAPETLNHDSGLWTPKPSTIPQTQSLETSTALSSSERISSTWSPSVSIIIPLPTWNSDSLRSATDETKAPTSTVPGGNGSPETVITKVFVTETKTVGISVNATAASTITAFVIDQPKTTQSPVSFKNQEPGVDWDAWTPDHKAGLVVGVLSGVFVLVGLSLTMWRMHQKRQSENRAAHDVEGGERTNLSGTALPWKILERVRYGGKGGRSPPDEDGNRASSTPSAGGNEASNTNTPADGSRAPPSSMDGESPCSSDDGHNGSEPTGGGSVHSSQPTSPSSPSVRLHNPSGSIENLEKAVDISPLPTPSNNRSQMFIPFFGSFKLPELPNTYGKTPPKPFTPSTLSIQPTPSAIITSNNSVNSAVYAYRRAASNRPCQSRALGHSIPLNVVHRDQILGRSKSNALHPVPAWEYGVVGRFTQAGALPEESMEHASTTDDRTRVQGSLQERLAGKYPARWG